MLRKKIVMRKAGSFLRMGRTERIIKQQENYRVYQGDTLAQGLEEKADGIEQVIGS